MTTVEQLTAATDVVCAAFGTTRPHVVVSFTFDRDGAWWQVAVETEPKDRRRKANHRTSGSGETLDEAVAECVRKRHLHEAV